MNEAEMQKQLADLIESNKSLLAKGADLTDAESAKLEEDIPKARKLMNTLKSARELGEIDSWAGQSASAGVALADPTKNNADPRDPAEIEAAAKAAASGSGEIGKVRLNAILEDGHIVIDTTGSDPNKGRYTFEAYDERPLLDKKTYELVSSSAYKSAFKEYLREGERRMGGDALKILQEGVDTSGGFLVPEDILAAIIQKEPTPVTVQGRVRQLQTMRDNLIIPRVNYTTDDLYTTGIRATWTGEVPTSATAARVTEPVFGQTRIPVYTAMMSMPITNDMIEDAAFPLVSWASSKFAETIELLKDNMILNGSGIGQPSGILLNPGGSFQPAVVTTGQPSTLTADALENLAFNLPPQYDQGATYVFNKLSTAKTIAQLKDGQGRYLWGAGMQDSGMVPGWKDRKLWGYDILYSEFMPAIGASTYPVIFGDLSAYYLLNRVGFSMQILRELYAETNQILMLGRIRFGGQVAEDWKLKILQCHS